MRIFLVAFLFLSACNYNHVKSQDDKNGFLSKEDLNDPDYETVRAFVLAPYCVGCHSKAGGDQGSANLESYKAVRDLALRVGYRSLESKDMPKSAPLPQAQMDVLKRWLDNGSPEKVIGGGSEKPGRDLNVGPTNWSKIKNKIFKDKCLDCHQGQNPDGGLDLTDVKVARLKILSVFSRVFTDKEKPMPPAPYPTVTKAEADVLWKWYTLGMPE